MPGKSSLDKALAKIEKDHGKIIELLQRELEAERTQAEAARASAQEAQSKLQGLEGRRPALASEVFGGPKAFSELDELDSEIARLRRHLDVAEIAEEQATARMPALEARMQEAQREASAKRYNVLAAERKERAVALDAALTAVTEEADALLELDQRQAAEERQLGIQPLGVTYAEVLDLHLGCRLRRHMRAAALASNNINFDQQRAPLVSKDWRTRTLEDIRAENEAEMEQTNHQREQREAHDQAQDKHQRYTNRKSEIYSHYGASSAGGEVPGGPGRRGKIDRIVADRLSHEFPREFEAEQRVVIAKRRAELRGLLGYDRPDEELSDDERQQLDERVTEQLAEEFHSAPVVEVIAG